MYLNLNLPNKYIINSDKNWCHFWEIGGILNKIGIFIQYMRGEIDMKRNRRIVGGLLVAVLVVSSTVSGVAAEKPKASKDVAYVRPDYTIETEDSALIFKSMNGKRVYPLVYKDNTYLPIRAISALIDEDVEWEGYSQTVYIGKTLSNPNKSVLKKDLESKKSLELVEKESYTRPGENLGMVAVSLRPDVLIMYDFEIQNFQRDNGEAIVPIIYEGTTYLPIESIADMMGKDISWDSDKSTITIKELGLEEDIKGEQECKLSDTERMLIEEFDSAVALYDQATDKLLTLQKSKDAEMRQLLAASISEDFLKAQEQARRVRSLDIAAYTDVEKTVHQDIHQFLEISEYYVLVIENIAYMAINDQDYSMLAETFFTFAMDTQSKMDIARSAVEGIRP